MAVHFVFWNYCNNKILRPHYIEYSTYTEGQKKSPHTEINPKNEK